MLSCSPIEELKIGNISNVEFKGFNGNNLSLVATVPIENPNSMGIKLKDADFTVTANNVVLGKIKQTEPLVIEGKSAKDYPIKVNIELTGVNANLLSLYGLINDRPTFYATGSVNIKSGLYRKKLKLTNYQIKY